MNAKRPLYDVYSYHGAFYDCEIIGAQMKLTIKTNEMEEWKEIKKIEFTKDMAILT